ncbi:branched-chain-amino-acid transaminase [Candidatus Formimonas warabiya]|uniref:Branched-chain-amino-acid aminotransferase n=1 Tax=Formimonas warabiya TaxID=1761012 RepID=A0A3G1KS26_FORW1|nr:branched-chain-amino-acid transaminase [Candidatus Formimonas warabiya]ATW25261.1 branched-chain-amino-acid transaminase [Candidatus Formimonas warabiya]
MGLIIYLDGQYVEEEQAKVSVFDHGLLYGDGVFEGIRAYNGVVFKLKEHLKRLYQGAHTMGLKINETPEEMAQVVTETCRRNDLTDAYIRLVVTRGKGDLGLDPRKCAKTTTFCISATIKLYPEELYQTGLELITVATRRNIAEACNPRVKSLNYLNNIYAKMEANLAGVPEAVLLNNEGYVAEATGDNIFFVRDGVLYTPPISAGLLEGVTRNCVIDLAKKRGIEVREVLFTRMDLYTADECFLTGTAAEAIPAVKYDGRMIGTGQPGEITKMLIQDYRDYVRNAGDGEKI